MNKKDREYMRTLVHVKLMILGFTLFYFSGVSMIIYGFSGSFIWTGIIAVVSGFFGMIVMGQLQKKFLGKLDEKEVV